MCKTTVSIFLLSFLTLTQLATANFEVINDTDTDVWLVYSVIAAANADYPAGWHTSGWYTVKAHNTEIFAVPPGNTNVYFHVTRPYPTEIKPIDHENRAAYPWLIHPWNAFIVVEKADGTGTLLKSNQPAAELVRKNLYEYPNGGTLRIAADGMHLMTQRPSDGTVVHIPDQNLRSFIEKALGTQETVTTTVRNAVTIIQRFAITAGEMLTLTELGATNANIQDLTGLEFARNLTWLDLGNNNISDVSALSGLTHLTTLGLLDNNISDVSALSGLTNLIFLSLRNNNISDVSALSGLTNLTTLDLDSSNISDVSVLSGLTNLTTLDLGNNNISDVSALSGLTHLTTLDLSDNNISDVSALSGLTHLTTLDLGNNNVSDVSALVGLTHLTTLDLESNNISDFSPIAGLVVNLQAYDDRNQGAKEPVHIPDANLRRVIEHELEKPYNAKITRGDMRSLTKLSSRTSIVQADGNVKSVDLAPGPIQNLTGLEFAKNLRKLYLRQQQISDISALKDLTNLRELHLSDNNISDVSALVGLTNLTWLYLDGNNISDVSALVGLTNLTTLDLSDNNISDVSALAGLTNLTILNLADNLISDFSPIAGLVPNIKLYWNDNQGHLVPGGGWVRKTTNGSGGTVYKHSDGNETVLIKGLDLQGLSSSKGYADYTEFLPPYYGKHFRLYDQGNNNTCGQTSARILLYYYGIEVSEQTFDDMADISHTVVGVTPYEMLEGLNFSFGVQAHKYLKPVTFVLPNTHSALAVERYYNKTDEDLRDKIKRSRPPIIVTRVSQWGYHHVVVIGYDTKSNAFLIADPNGLFYWQKWDKWTALTRYDPPLIFPPLKVMWSLDNLLFQELGNAATSPNSKVWRGIYDDLSKDQANLAIQELTTVGELFKYFTTESPILLGPLKWLIADPLGFIKPYSMFVPKEPPQYHNYASKTFRITQWGPDHDDLLPCEHRRWKQTKSVNGNVEVAIFGAKPVRSTCKLGLGYSASYNRPDINNNTVTVSGRIEEGKWKTYGSKGFLVGALTIYYQPTSSAPSVSLSSNSLTTALLPNYPNPFNPETWIPYQLAEPAEVTLNIYSVDGKLIRTLALGHQAAGAYHTKARAAYWDGRNAQGERVASGLYFYTLIAGDFSATGKMLIVK